MSPIASPPIGIDWRKLVRATFFGSRRLTSNRHGGWTVKIETPERIGFGESLEFAARSLIELARFLHIRYGKTAG